MPPTPVDPAGVRTAKTDKHANITSNYTYDPLYELTQVTQTTTTETYSYDAVGNRLTSLSVSPYDYNSSNELTSTPNATYTYDNNGNTLTKVTSAGTTTYDWDYENRLTSVALPGTGGTLAFKYDGFGRRVQKVFTQGSNTTTTNYLYDGDSAVGDVDQNGNVLARYTAAQKIDEPLAQLRTSTTSYYEQDGLGSVTSLTNSAGTIANTYSYDSYGSLTASSGSIVNRFLYTSRDFDTETGLYFYRARYYDPSTGRFLSEDPLEFGGAGINFFGYAYDSPMNFIDPWGTQSQQPCGIDRPCGPSLYQLPPYLTPPPMPSAPALPSGWDLEGGNSGLMPDPFPAPAAPGVPAPGPDYHQDKKPGNCKNQDGCHPCKPPVGSLSYRPDSGAGRSGTGVHHGQFPGPHWHLWEMHQRPAPDCTCFWVELGSGQGPTPWPKKVDPAGGGPK